MHCLVLEEGGTDQSGSEIKIFQVKERGREGRRGKRKGKWEGTEGTGGKGREGRRGGKGRGMKEEVEARGEARMVRLPVC